MRLIFFVILFISNFAMATPNSSVGFEGDQSISEKMVDPVTEFKDEPMVVAVSNGKPSTTTNGMTEETFYNRLYEEFQKAKVPSEEVLALLENEITLFEGRCAVGHKDKERYDDWKWTGFSVTNSKLALQKQGFDWGPSAGTVTKTKFFVSETSNMDRKSVESNLNGFDWHVVSDDSFEVHSAKLRYNFDNSIYYVKYSNKPDSDHIDHYFCYYWKQIPLK